ncbi:MFS transporter [Rhodococcus koreensis]|uniref:MFS transporter n=1 Tax=Rhodococcus koreensis TaxID=99653 RepID=UPI003672C7F2
MVAADGVGGPSRDGATGFAHADGAARTPADPARTSFTLQLSLGLAAIAFAVLQSMMAPALLWTESRFDSDPQTTTWVLTSFLLACAAATPIGGRVGSAKGKKKVLLAALGIMAIGLVVSAFAPTLEWMIFGRVLQGASGALFPLAIALLRENLPPAKVTTAVGLFTATVNAGGGVGLVIAGPLMDHLGYIWLFLAPLVVVIIAAALVSRFVIESHDTIREPVEYAGGILLVGWLVAILLPASQGKNWGWSAAPTLTCLALFPVLFVLWILTERRADHPVVDMRLMRRRGVWQANLVMFLNGACMFGMFSLLPMLLQARHADGGLDESVVVSGLLMLPMPVAMFVFGTLSGSIIKKMGPRVPVVAGSTILLAGCAVLTVFHDDLRHILLSCGIIGVGFGLIQSALANTVLAAVEPTETGVAIGMNTNMRIVGGTLGIQGTILVLTTVASGSGVSSAASYMAALAFLTCLGAATTAASLLLPKSCTPSWDLLTESQLSTPTKGLR